ncbi:MAG: hypothetical protein U0893_08875 [Chloroflexota bacterium]
MGQEARCLARVGEQTVEVKALLESDELILRGEHRARLRFTELDGVEAADGRLTLRRGGEAVVLELGATAERWAAKILNPRTLLDKLGVKPGQRACAVGLTDADLLAKLRSATMLTELPPVGTGALPPEAPDRQVDLVFVEVRSRDDLAALGALREWIVQAGAVWVLHPKGRADLRDTDVMAAGKAAGLVDNKVARVSATLSALRFVIPKASRNPSPPIGRGG